LILNRRQFAGGLGLAALGALGKTGAAWASADGTAAAGVDLSFVNPELRSYARAYIEHSAKDGSEPLTLNFILK
jgi:hypothetical protein